MKMVDAFRMRQIACKTLLAWRCGKVEDAQMLFCDSPKGRCSEKKAKCCKSLCRGNGATEH